MEEKRIVELYRQAEEFLSERLLKDTFDVITEMLGELHSLDLTGRLEQLQTTYKFMLKYTVAGVNDPERDKIYSDLFISTYKLIDESTQRLLTKDSNAFPYVVKRTFGNVSIEAATRVMEEVVAYYDKLELAGLVDGIDSNKEDDQKYTKNLSFLFNYFWTSDFYNSEIVGVFNSFLEIKNAAYHDKCLMVSALTLSLMRCFDVEKTEMLLSLSVHPEDEIRQRAIFGVLIALYMYDNRLTYYPLLSKHLNLLSEDKRFVKSVEVIVIQLIRSKETEKLTKRMQEDILPEMVKMNPYIMDKLNLDNIIKEDTTEDKNPDWKHILDEVPGLTNKLEELTNLQMEGADVFMSTFAMLKSFPFFNDFVNWFIPFNLLHPQIKPFVDAEMKSGFISSIVNTRFLCNSDKYSFLLSVQQIPSSYKNAMAQSLSAELGQMDESENDEAIIKPDLKAEKISNQYIQDLYRFTKLHPKRTDFDDMFSWRLDFHNKAFFSRIIQKKETWRNIAEYYFAKNYFVESIEVFEILLKDDTDNIELLQKIGYAYQVLGDYNKALEYYLKVDIIKSQNLWTLKKIAFCYRQLGNPLKALEYYKQAEVLDDENLSIQFSIGHCLLDQKQYSDALKCYFRVEYLDTTNTRVWKPIAWCSFVVGNMDQATKYYNKIINNDSNCSVHDYLNFGHVKWVNNDRAGALNMYKKSVEKLNGKMDKYLNLFNIDKALLVEKGIDMNEIPIMLDRLRYDLSE